MVQGRDGNEMDLIKKTRQNRKPGKGHELETV